MKTIATAAVLMMLSASAWADETKHQEQAANDEPILLSDAEMDRVTAGNKDPNVVSGYFNYYSTRFKDQMCVNGKCTTIWI